MRSYLAVVLVLGVVACDRSDARGPVAPSAMTTQGRRMGLAGGPAVTPPGLSQRPLDGTGIDHVLPMWTGATTLGVAPLRIDVNGDVVLRPGVSIIVVSADGTKCRRISGDMITSQPPVGGCPTAWP